MHFFLTLPFVNPLKLVQVNKTVRSTVLVKWEEGSGLGLLRTRPISADSSIDINYQGNRKNSSRALYSCRPREKEEPTKPATSLWRRSDSIANICMEDTWPPRRSELKSWVLILVPSSWKTWRGGVRCTGRGTSNARVGRDAAQATRGRAGTRGWAELAQSGGWIGVCRW
jgi:hypothetical protein